MAAVNSRLVHLSRKLLDILLPIHCPSCGREVAGSSGQGVYCTRCRPSFDAAVPVVCPVCRAVLPDRAFISESGCVCCDSMDVPLHGLIALGPY
ncbi:hypothetical protein JXA80_10825, partial [bacterium]|nr:hypothetical protein [candidate division CSSED10-310 bacterium]